MSLSAQDRKVLLSYARGVLERDFGLISSGSAPRSQACAERGRGAFVSLYTGRSLRGCIGMITSEKTLFETVGCMAVEAATRDLRFQPLQAQELNSVSIEISVLSPLEVIRGPEDIQIGRDGIYICQGARSGLLLPQVAERGRFSAVSFLEQVCLKAGLEPDTWTHRESVKLFRFQAEVFGEN